MDKEAFPTVVPERLLSLSDDSLTCPEQMQSQVQGGKKPQIISIDAWSSELDKVDLD